MNYFQRTIFALVLTSTFAPVAMAQSEPTPFYFSIFTPQQKLVQYSSVQLKGNQPLTEQLLFALLKTANLPRIQQVFTIYQAFPAPNPLLVALTQGKIALLQGDESQAIRHYRTALAIDPNLNTARFQLAILLFQAHQNDNALRQFRKLQSVPSLPANVQSLINQYIQAISKRTAWQWDFSFHYVKDKNINKVSDNPYIDDAQHWRKNASVLPQTAEGVDYYVSTSKLFNLRNAHHLYFSASLDGETYWNNHPYDDLLSRVTLGYRYQNADSSLELLPFYQYRWIGSQAYQFSNGLSLNAGKWLTPRWRGNIYAEYKKNHFFDSTQQNGHNWFSSLSFYFVQNPKTAFYFGASWNKEHTSLANYHNQTLQAYAGWSQEWLAGVSSKFSLSLAKRRYQDEAFLGSANGLRIYLGKNRQDTIYQSTLALWKRDWYWLNITPKLELRFKKQQSNLPQMYSYQERNINLIFEKKF